MGRNFRQAVPTSRLDSEVHFVLGGVRDAVSTEVDVGSVERADTGSRKRNGGAGAVGTRGGEQGTGEDTFCS